MAQRDPADPHNLNAAADSFTRTVSFTVDGLRSEKCVSTIESALQKKAGVRDVTADLNAELLTVSYDLREIDAAAIHELILSTGYKPTGMVG